MKCLDTPHTTALTFFGLHLILLAWQTKNSRSPTGKRLFFELCFGQQPDPAL